MFPPDARVARALADLRPEQPDAAPRDLAARMAALCRPGVGVAVIDDFAVVWAGGFGVRRVGDAAPVAADTPFQAASISKPVFALAVMRLAQDGRLDLDADVAASLASWRVPASENGAAPRLTLRQLLSHSAGTGIDGFPGYRPGAALPTVPQILDGAPPANTPPVRVERPPGLEFRYSGGGTMIAQLAVTDALGRAFPELMRDLVLGPLDLQDSAFAPPPGAAILARAAAGHLWNGAPLPGGHRVYPELAAAGLWATPRDLARLGAAAMRTLRGEATPLGLRADTLAAMLRPQLPGQAAHGAFAGIGWMCAGSGAASRFGHQGENEGFLSELRLCPATGQGAAVMVNAMEGRPLLAEILAAIEREYRWPGAPRAA